MNKHIIKTLLLIIFSCPVAAVDTIVNRDEVFLMEGEQKTTEGDWQALFCQKDDLSSCELTDIQISEADCCTEFLVDNTEVVSLTYPARKNMRLMFFIKGLNASTGVVETPKSFVQNRFIKQGERLSFHLQERQYRVEAQWPDLLLKVEGGISKQQFIKAIDDQRCTTEILQADPSVRFRAWVGDVDADNKADFFFYGSASQASCWRGSQTILMLSTLAGKSDLGKVLKSDGY